VSLGFLQHLSIRICSNHLVEEMSQSEGKSSCSTSEVEEATAAIECARSL
jgi:hypothetical protein